MITTNEWFVETIFLSGLSLFQYAGIFFYEKDHYYITNFFATLFIFIIRNYTLLYFIEYTTRNRPSINDIGLDAGVPKEEYPFEFHVNLITSTAVESATHLLIKNTIIDMPLSGDLSSDLLLVILYNVVYFIPGLFLYDGVFDFFHYIAHRILHNNNLYKLYHKKHHKFNHPVAITTFYQHPMDIIISSSVPTVLTLLVIPPVSYLQFSFIIVYKNYLEIKTHSGKWYHPSDSEVMRRFPWLSKVVEVTEFGTEDHDLHHSLHNCNYAKKFSVWDKMFHTYKSPYAKKTI
jgi:sterol desaturase/sphingolipid hydroxylase (fatty acid hydroxylase superfamily)